MLLPTTPQRVGKYVKTFAELIEKYDKKENIEIFCNSLEDFVDNNFSIFTTICTHLNYVKLTKEKISNLNTSIENKLKAYEIYSKDINFYNVVKEFVTKGYFEKKDIPLVKEAGEIIEFLVPPNIDFFDIDLDEREYYSLLEQLVPFFPSLREYDLEKRLTDED